MMMFDIDLTDSPAAIVHSGVWGILCGTFVHYIPMSITTTALSLKELIVSIFSVLENFRVLQVRQK